MGLVLMSGSVGISAKANNTPGSKPVEATESPGDMETDAAENTDQSTNLNVPGTLTIAGFDDLPEDVLLQDISSENTGAVPYLPESLSADVYVGTPEEEKAAANSYSILKAVLSVSKTLTSEKETREIDGLQWKIEPSGSLYSEFKLESGAYYAYTPVFPETDGEGNKIVLGDNAKNEIPGIVVLVDGGPEEDIDTGMNLAADADDGTGTGPSNVSTNYGITVTGGDAAKVWNTETNRIVIESSGEYTIKGELITTGLDTIPEDNQSADPFIDITGSGEYHITLRKGLEIDISDMEYRTLLNIRDSNATVYLETDGGNAELLCKWIDTNQKVISNNGTLVLQNNANLNCDGLVNNTGTLILENKSQLNLQGDITNTKNVEIKESSQATTKVFTNEGTLTIHESTEPNKKSKLEVAGGLTNSNKLVVDNGALTITTETRTINGENVTFVGKLENSGTAEIVNESKVEVVEITNNPSGNLTVDGNDTILRATGPLDNGGNLKVDNWAKVSASKLNNNGSLTIGTKKDTGGSVVVKGGSENKNGGTILIEAKSTLVTDGGSPGKLINGGTLTLKSLDCLGSGNTEIVLDSEGDAAKFILDALGEGMIRLKNGPVSLDYSGKDQTPAVTGEDGAIELLNPYNFHHADFDVVTKIKQESITLFREKRERGGSGIWDPGIDEVGTAESGWKEEVSVIRDPGEYTVKFVNANNEEQNCSIDGISMSEWSMIVHTNKEEDELSAEKYDSKGIDSAVYDYRDTITVWVEVAIFSERSSRTAGNIPLGPGNVILYWDAVEERSDTPKPQEIRTPLPVVLDANGYGTTKKYEIRTSGGNGIDYRLIAPYDSDNLADGSLPYEQPYKLTAVYRTVGNNEYTANTSNPQKPTGNHASTPSLNPNLKGWFEDKMLIVKRPTVEITFGEDYRSNIRTYDANPMKEPEFKRDIIFTPDDTEDRTLTWYQGTKEEVELASQTGNTSGLQLVDWKDTVSSGGTGGTVSPSNVEDTEGSTEAGTYPPRNAGFYLLEVEVKPTPTSMGAIEYQIFTINPRPANVKGSSRSKAYGEEDPNWGDSSWYIDDLLPGDELIGQIDRERGENAGTYLVTRGSLRNENYTINFTPGKFVIEPRQLEWNNEYLFMVTQDGFSVVGGLGLKYTAEENDDELIEELWENDDVSLSIARLNLAADSNKVTVDAPELVGKAKNNYTLTLDRAVELLPENKFKLAVITGIDTQTPDKIKDVVSSLDTTDKIKAAMEDAVVSQGASKRNVSVYDIILTNIDGSQPTEEQKEKILQTGLTVTLPYPAGTAKDTHSFVAAHMFTEEINTDGGVKSAGYIEKPKTERTDDGIRIQVASLSPVSVGWNTMQGFNPDSPNGGNNNGNNNGTNGGDGNNGTNGGTNNGTNNGTNGGTNNGTNSGNNSNNGTNNNGTDNKTNGTTNNTNKTGTTSTTKTTGVKTGDQAQIAFYMITTLIACLLLILIIFLIRAQFRKKD